MLIPAFLIGLVAGVILVATTQKPKIITQENPQTKVLLQNYKNYESKCEMLLDTICSYYPDFNDTVAETDTYSDYLDARDLISPFGK